MEEEVYYFKICGKKVYLNKSELDRYNEFIDSRFNDAIMAKNIMNTIKNGR